MCTLRLLGIQFFFEQLLKWKGKTNIIMCSILQQGLHSLQLKGYLSTQFRSLWKCAMTIWVSWKMHNHNLALSEMCKNDSGLFDICNHIKVSLKMCNHNLDIFENVQQWFGYPWKCAATILGIFEMAERNYPSPQDQKQNQIVHSTLIPLLQILTVCEKQQEMEHRCLHILRKWSTNSWTDS